MKLLSITQEQLANGLCLILTTSGIALSIASVFPVEMLDRLEARILGKDFLTTGVTLGFGVGVAKNMQGKNKEKGIPGTQGTLN
jgi:hypothetical protein